MTSALVMMVPIMEKLLLTASSLGMLGTVATLVLVSWLVAAGLLVGTLVTLALGLDWAISRHHAQQDQEAASYALDDSLGAAEAA